METLHFVFTSTFYPPYHVGGDATHVEYLAEELVKRGHEVHIIHSLDAYKIKRNKQLPVKQTEQKKNLFINTLESPLRTLEPLITYTFGNSLWTSRKFTEVVTSIHPDVVHHHNISLLGYNLLKKDRITFPCILLMITGWSVN